MLDFWIETIEGKGIYNVEMRSSLLLFLYLKGHASRVASRAEVAERKHYFLLEDFSKQQWGFLNLVNILGGLF
jgi:hypothetical protein